MYKIFIFLIVCSVFVSSCKKKNLDPVDTDTLVDGAYMGKVKSINGTAWRFFYTEDGKIKEYKYNSSGIIKTATVTWESNQVTCNDGIGFIYTRPFNSAGYALPGNDDQQVGKDWSYDAENHITYLNGIEYYWSNGNIDSLKLGGALTIFEYNSYLETRDMGARFIPELNNFPDYNLNLKNLRNKIVQFDTNGDTLNVRLLYYTFDSNNRVASETVYVVANSDTSYLSQRNYDYYE